jgi:hypothetical protein
MAANNLSQMNIAVTFFNDKLPNTKQQQTLICRTNISLPKNKCSSAIFFKH